MESTMRTIKYENIDCFQGTINIVAICFFFVLTEIYLYIVTMKDVENNQIRQRK